MPYRHVHTLNYSNPYHTSENHHDFFIPHPYPTLPTTPTPNSTHAHTHVHTAHTLTHTCTLYTHQLLSFKKNSFVLPPVSSNRMHARQKVHNRQFCNHRARNVKPSTKKLLHEQQTQYQRTLPGQFIFPPYLFSHANTSQPVCANEQKSRIIILLTL